MLRKLPALLGSLVLALLAALGGVAGAGSLRDGSGLEDLSRLVAALTPGSQKLHFSGVLTQNDVPVPKGNQKLRFSIWTDLNSTDTALMKWQEDQTVAVRNGGVINVFLGSSTPFPEGVFENDDLFLGIDLLDSANVVVTAFPRQELAHVPKAFRAVGAGKADKLDDTKCAKCVKESHVQDKVIGHEKIKDNAVRKEQIDDRAVAREKIDDKAVGRDKIDDKAVGRGNLDDKVVGRGQLDDKAVGRGNLDDKAVGKAQLDDKAVGKAQLDTGAALDALPGYSVMALAGSFAWTGTRTVAATIGVDGLPVIAFPSELGVAVAHCADLACTAASVNTISGLGTGSLAIAIGPNGMPLVASGTDLATCDDLACSTSTIDGSPSSRSAIAVTASGEVVTVGDDQAIGVGGHGGMIFVNGGSQLEADICRGIFDACDRHVVLDSSGADQISLAINAQGGAIAAYTRGGELLFAQCDDPLCTTHTSGVLDTASSGVIDGTSIAIGRDGRPVIAYAKRTGSFSPHTVFVAHCSTSTCSSATVVAASFDPATFGAYAVEGTPSVTIGRDGLPLIAFQSLGQLQVLHCGNVFCVPNVRAR